MVRSPEIERIFRRIPIEALRGDSFLQSAPWARIKEATGWKAHAFDEAEGTFLVLERPLFWGCSLAYLPHGLAGSRNPEGLRHLAPHIENALLLRWDLPDSYTEYDACKRHEKMLRSAALLPAPEVQTPTTVTLNLQQDSSKIFAAMKKKTRYNIRLAERKGLHISETEDLRQWFILHQATAQRQNIAIRKQSYYEAVMWHFRNEGGRVHVYLAHKDGNLLAGIFVLHWKHRASYLYGASDLRWRALMAPYLLQWHAMQHAAACGMTSYDLCGIAKTKDAKDALAGLYRFKTGFGGRIQYRPGCWDIVYRPLRARMFRGLERFRQRSRSA